LVFCPYTFILCHQWTGGLRPRWAKKPLNTFTAALEALRTAISFLFIDWFNWNPDVFPSYRIKPVWATFVLDFCLRPVREAPLKEAATCVCFQGINFLITQGVHRILNLTEERCQIFQFLPTACQKYYLFT
jgi:hypothetical protein